MVEGQESCGLDERLVVDTSEKLPTYLFLGKNGSYVKLSPSAYHLLKSIRAGTSFDALATALSQRQARRMMCPPVYFSAGDMRSAKA